MATAPRDIWLYYNRSLEVLALVESALRDPDIAAAVSSDSPFYKMTPQQLPDVLKQMATELALEVSLALVASFEAILRIDFDRQVRAPATGSKSVAAANFQKLWRTHGVRTRLEDLLDAWRAAHPGATKVVGDFKGVLKWRHWLAHGRYWPQKGFAGFDPYTVEKRAKALQKALPSLPPLVDW